MPPSLHQLEARVNAHDQRMDRQDEIIDGLDRCNDEAHQKIWDKMEDLGNRMDRLPAWATCLIGILTGALGATIGLLF